MSGGEHREPPEREKGGSVIIEAFHDVKREAEAEDADDEGVETER